MGDEYNNALVDVGAALVTDYWSHVLGGRKMAEAEWEAAFRPRYESAGGDDFFQDFDEDRAFIMSLDLHYVWTQISYDGETELALLPGIHCVNREGFWVTEVPWTEEQADLIILLDEWG